MWRELQDLMWRNVGLLRTADKLESGLARIRDMRARDLPALALPDGGAFNMAGYRIGSISAGPC